jgi:hypothetical protein
VAGVYIISPYECPTSAIYSIEKSLAKAGQVQFYCGIRLLELFAEHWGSFLLFESDVLVSYLSTLKSGIADDNPLMELILRKSILAELPTSFQSIYVLQRFYLDFRQCKIDPQLNEPLTVNRDVAKLEAQLTALTTAATYLRACNQLALEVPDEDPLMDYLSATSSKA